MALFTLRSAVYSDLSRIREIYAWFVENSTASLDIDTPGMDEMELRWNKIQESYSPFIVCESAGKIAGYAYAVPYRPRDGYRYTAEFSVYIDRDCHGMGIGKRLLAGIMDECRRQGYHQLVSVITGAEGNQSFLFHKHNGFTYRGYLESVGYKFGEYIDLHFFQKML